MDRLIAHTRKLNHDQLEWQNIRKSIVVMWQSYARKFVSRSDWENWVY